MRQAILSLVATLLLSSTLAAEPRNIRLSWTSPDTAHTQTISWTSDHVGDADVVQYGYVAPGQFEVEASSVQGPGDLGAIFEAELVDLKPATVYEYRIGEPGNWSPIYTFTTAPEGPCQPFRFAALGDNRPDADWLPQLKWNPILEESTDAAPAFFLHTGDIVKEGKEVKQWIDFLNNSDPHLTSTPLLAAIGNHDDGPVDGEGANYNQIFALPRNSVTNTEDFYYFTYGNAIFVSLSSQTYSGGDTPFAMQAQWLDDVLTENPAMWKFVYLHHPPFASHEKFDLIFTEFEFNHPPDEKGFNATLVPIFDKHHVDIVFAGHNHYYERIGPLTNGADPAEGTYVPDPANGTIYVITGGAGAMVYDEFEIPWVEIEVDLIDWVCGKATGSKACAGDHHYVVIDIDDGHLHFEARATAQQTVGWDEGNKALIDAFDIFKESDPVCTDPPPADDPVVVEPEPDVVVEPFAPEVIDAPDVPSDLPGPGEVVAEVAPEVVAPVDGLEETRGEISAAEEANTVEPITLGPDGGCGCRIADTGPGATPVVTTLLLLGLFLSLRRRRQPLS